MARKPYPSDVTDDEWAFIAPYLTLMREDAPQREHPLRELLNGPKALSQKIFEPKLGSLLQETN